MKRTADFAVIGAGVVGASIAFGLVQRGHSVLLLDGAQTDPRASGANFGLVWVQGKGSGIPEYQSLTRLSSDSWSDFAEELTATGEKRDETLALERNGGLTFTFGEDGFQDRKTLLDRLHNERGADGDDIEMITRKDIMTLMPDFALGDQVSGASFCWRDGCVNPLRLHALLLQVIERKGNPILWGAKVHSTERINGSGWVLHSEVGQISAGHVVVAAGLGARKLAVQFGLDVPVRPQRGQVMVSQRMPRVMGLPASTLRQTTDGTFLVGATKEDIDFDGFDAGTSFSAAKQLAQNALRITPMLKNIDVVRHWAGLRVMTPDGAPIYHFGETASAAACHSGITLAPIHARLFVECLLTDSKNTRLDAFSPRRFSGEKLSQTQHSPAIEHL